jgi:hypothetical protein
VPEAVAGHDHPLGAGALGAAELGELGEEGGHGRCRAIVVPRAGGSCHAVCPVGATGKVTAPGRGGGRLRPEAAWIDIQMVPGIHIPI